MQTIETYGWGVTQRRTSDEGEAARKEALAWLEANADENVGAEVVLKRVPDASGGLGIARADSALVGVVVTTGPTAYIEASDDSVVGGLLDGLLEGEARLRTIWARAGLSSSVASWADRNGGAAGASTFDVLRCSNASEVDTAGARLATMSDLRALEEYAQQYAEECGSTPTRDLPSAVARGEAVLVEDGDALASVALKLGQSTRLGCIGGSWTAPHLRRRGFARRATGHLLRSVLDSRSLAHALVAADNEQGRVLYDSLGFRPGGGVVRVDRNAG